MSQTKVFAANLGTTVRSRITSSLTRAGQGQSKRWYVGRHGLYDYDSYVRFALDWTGVGSIVSAVLTIYTGDGLGDTPSTTTESPKVGIRRLLSAFSEGNAPDGSWQTDDWTGPTVESGVLRAYPTRAELGVNNIDITSIVRAWAPSTVAGGGRAPNYGIALNGFSDTNQNIDLVSDKWADSALRPYITLTYDYGVTVPSAPSNLTPTGTVASITDFQGDFVDVRTTDTVAKSAVQVFADPISATASATADTITRATPHGLVAGDPIYITSASTSGLPVLTVLYVLASGLTSTAFKVSTAAGGAAFNITGNATVEYTTLLYNAEKAATAAEATADRFTHVPDDLTLVANTSYYWRARVTDQEGQTSAWTALTEFNFSNTVPSAPTLTPADASSFATPDGIQFRGTFTDADAGDTMVAYEVQMSPYPEGDDRWNDNQYRLWSTGKRYIAPTTEPFSTPYGGSSLAAGTYYWRARVYDSKHAPSAWAYASIIFTDSFEQDPEVASTAIQLRPRAPWRILIKDMGANRGPGNVVAILEDAKNVGASELYNSPGELHFTLPKDHPQIAVIEPRQTHYAVEFRQGDGWHEVFAGLIVDFDATDTDVVFYGIDYLGLYDFLVDERYDASNPEKPAENGGSKYVTTGKNSISYIVTDQLAKAKALSNSPVGFITTGTIATMSETLVVYSTYAPVLQFVTGLLDSHRAGTGKRTRLRIRKTSAGGYEAIVQDDPGVVRDNLRMRYGELVQGYRLVAFGQDWASRILGIGRAKDGIKVMYEQRSSPGIDEATWGRFAQVRLFDGVSDANDLQRRVQQAATASGKLGKNLGLGLRSGVLQPKDGYDVADVFPIDIEDGSVSTAALGSGYWACVGVTWECSAKDGKQNTTLSFQPREDTEAPDTDILTLQPISPQAQWQIGWTDPNPLTATSLYWLNQTTGEVFIRTDGEVIAESGITGSPGDTITTPDPHGLIADDSIMVGNLVGGRGLVENQRYLVISDGLTATEFKVAILSEGTPVAFDTALTDGTVVRTDTYEVLDDGNMTPPDPVPTPTAPTLSSALVSGIVRLRVQLNDTPEAKVRSWEVQLTHKYIEAAADWTTPLVFNLPQGSTELSIPALGSTVYTTRVRAIDVFGNESSFSNEVEATTVAGSDSLSAALADLANDVSDGIITETKIADNAISTPKLQAGAVTADILAATIVLASLIKTASSGRRIELDVDGIRLFDSDESLLVRIPTNGDPVYVKGQVTADAFVSETSADLRTAVSLAGSAVMTVQNGVSAPANVPTLAASVDYLTLTSSPASPNAGIGYDSGAGTFWLAADPASGYVAHEFDATTGAYVRSIAATGSTTTYTTTVGSTSHVSDSADGIVGTTDSHITTPLTIPSGLSNVQITKVAVWMAGRLGTCSTRVGVWSTSNVSLGESATFSAASGGATTVGASVLQNKTLSSPVAATAGTTYRVGFRRMNSSDGSQHDKDDGSGKTEYSGDGFTADGTGWGTRDSAGKPNAYMTYTYDVDDRLETSKMIGVATDGTYVYTLDEAGVVWKYLRSDGSYVANSSVQTAITGTKSKAGMFYDATAAELIITTTTGTGAGVYPKFVRVDPATLAVSTSVYSAAAGTTFDGATDTFRGGARLNDPLNSNAATYWVATTSAVYAYTFTGTTATQTSDRDFGQAATVASGLTHDGTQFRGYAVASPTTIWKFSAWDWTTASAKYWVGYAWYDSVATTHETALGPRASITMRRRERLQVQNSAIPTGGGDDPDKVRIYAKPNATEPAATGYWLQVTDALTSRYLTDYTGSGTADGSGAAFPSGTPAELKSALAVASGGWSLKGDGTFQFRQGTTFPTSPATDDRWFRTDLGMEFFYDGTRWLSTELFRGEFGPSRSNSISAITATTADATIWPIHVTPGSDIWLEDYVTQFYVSGGTALSASHKWVGDMHKRNSAGSNTTVATVNINSGASSTFRTITVAIDALLGSGYYVMQTTWTKTGTPGELTYYVAYITYRIVAT